MSQEIQVREQTQLPDVADPLAGYDQASPQQETVFHKVHKLLHGRYHWCILLGSILATLGAFAGYSSRKPIWSSSGTIQIKPSSKVIIAPIYETEQKNYDLFVATQMAALRSTRLASLAMADPVWLSLRRGAKETVQDFIGKLSVTRNAQYLIVSFDDPDAKSTAAAVQGIVGAYEKLCVERDAADDKQVLETLRVRVENLDRQHAAKRDRINLVAAPYGTENLQPLHRAQLDAQLKLQDDLDVVNEKLSVLSGSRPTNPVIPASNDLEAITKAMTLREIARLQTITNDEIAKLDAEMKQLLKTQWGLTENRELTARTRGANNLQLTELDRQIDLNDAAIKHRAEEWKQEATEQLNRGDLRACNPAAANELALLTARGELQAKIDKNEKELLQRAKDMVELDRLHAEDDALTKGLAQANDRREQLDIEQRGQTRIEVIKSGDGKIADDPILVKDARMQYSVAGAVGGMSMGFGLILGLSLLDRRFRRPDDVRHGAHLTLLGVLPSLPDDLADPDQAAVAAHCVHQIRTLLQIGHSKRRVIAITSPASGTGKTSLTLSLGVSFAAASSRTLIVDCDLVGGGLTARVETIVRRKIGQILRREGLITQQQLDMAMKLARNSQKKLGEILVDLGYLTEEDVRHALTLQEQRPLGIVDAMLGERVDECIAETGIQNLWILPLGAALPGDVSKFSPNAIRAVLAQTRERFDTVIIDTGPVPGSLEASVVAEAADAVVLVVSRGEHRPLAERSIRHLQEIGAVVAGMVFNRAEVRDVELVSTTARLSSYDRVGRSVPADVVSVDSPKFGPVARAVATRAPMGKSQDKTET